VILSESIFAMTIHNVFKNAINYARVWFSAESWPVILYDNWSILLLSSPGCNKCKRSLKNGNSV